LTAGSYPATEDAAGGELLAFRDVTFGYARSAPVLNGFSWSVRRGGFHAVLGPSGSGKTTLLHLAAGLRRPDSGSIVLDGRPVSAPSPRVGLMLQDYGLLPWFTARRNLEVGLAIAGYGRDARRQRVGDWLQRLGLSAHADRYPAQLSGGQRQRVALARQFALSPELLLLDEPLSAVDELTRERLQRQLHGLTRELGTTAVIVTHNIEEAVLLADTILLVTGDGCISTATELATPFGGELPRRADAGFQEFCGQIRERLGA